MYLCSRNPCPNLHWSGAGMSQVMGYPSPPPLQIPVWQNPPPQTLLLQVLIRLLSLVHGSATKRQRDRNCLLPKEKNARMWNSCAVDFFNNLLKINGKLRTEISSAVLCSQRITRLHKSTAKAWHHEQLNWQRVPRSQAGMGARLAGSCSPQSAWLWAGSCFWELYSL